MGFDELGYSWASGFFDGEGSIGVYARNQNKNKTTKYFVLVVSLAQSGDIGKEILSAFKNVYGGSLYSQQKAGNKIQWKWNISSDKAAEFLEDILNNLVIKYDEAKLALQFQALNNKRFDNVEASNIANKIKECKVNY